MSKSADISTERVRGGSVVSGVLVVVASLMFIAACSDRTEDPPYSGYPLRQITMALASYHHDLREFPVTTDDGPAGAAVLAVAVIGEVEDGQAQGFVVNDRRYGPYLDFDPVRIRLTDGKPTAILDVYGKPILYYHRTESADPENLWGPDGRFDRDHNGPDVRLDKTLLIDDSGEIEEAAARALRSARYLLVSAGEDGEYGTRDDHHYTGP